MLVLTTGRGGIPGTGIGGLVGKVGGTVEQVNKLDNNSSST